MRSRITATVIGTVLIGVLLNGLVLLNVSAYIQQIVVGVKVAQAVAIVADEAKLAVGS